MRKILLSTLFLLSCTMLMAGNIGKKQAMKKAQAVLGSNTPMQLVSMGDGVQPAYYVFNAQRTGKGFVIVAGEDTGDEILGYSEHGTFDPQNMPPALAWWLQCYQQQTELIRNGLAQPHRAPVIHEAIEPLVKTQWNQEEPYNGMLPINPMTADSTQYKHTGCVATAMAQILKYWSSEKGVIAIPGYSYDLQYQDSNGEVQTVTTEVDALNDTTFNYAIMQNTYTVADTATEAGKEVAMLMRYCGQAAGMIYYTAQGSAPTSGKYFATYFGFNPYYQELKRTDYSSTAWDAIIYGELVAKRPVIYSGSKVSKAGHAFICDGYKDGLFHINWGWGGHYDGYFKLSEANSYGTGTGAGNGMDGYSFDQQAIIRIQPESTEPVSEETALMTVSDLSVSGKSFTRANSSANFTVPVTFSIWNYTGFTYNFETGIGLYQGDSLLKTFPFYTMELRDKEGFRNREMNLEFGSDLPTGNYTLKAICRMKDAEKWKEDFGSTTRYIKLAMYNTTMTADATKDELRVNSVEFEGIKKVGSTLTVIANITNIGDMNYSTLYLFVNEKLVTGAGVNISHAESDNILLHFQATNAGTFPIKLCMNADGTGEIWSSQLTIETRKNPTSLAVGQTKVTNAIPDYVMSCYVIQGTTMNVTIPIQNKDTTAFKDIIVIELWKNYLDNPNSYSPDRLEYKEIEIAAGATNTVNIEIENLDIGHNYFVRLYVFDANGNLVQIGQTSAYPIVEDPAGIQNITIDSDTAAGTPVFDLSGRRVGAIGEPLPKGLYVVKGKKVLKK